MSTRVLLVRAVNVGGAKLPMAEFRELLAELGGTDVRTYIASGNAVLDVPGAAAAFDKKVEAALTARYGWTREVISRTPTQLSAALAAHPFEVVEPKYSYLSCCAAKPTASAIATAEGIDTGDERWAVIGADLHVRYAGGAGRAHPGMDRVLRAIGVPTTARNLRTVRALIDLAG